MNKNIYLSSASAGGGEENESEHNHHVALDIATRTRLCENDIERIANIDLFPKRHQCSPNSLYIGHVLWIIKAGD